MTIDKIRSSCCEAKVKIKKSDKKNKYSPICKKCQEYCSIYYI
jgi:hypothetical protein